VADEPGPREADASAADSFERLHRKLLLLYKPLGDSVAARLDPAGSTDESCEALFDALSHAGEKNASDVAWHLTEWPWSAAFILALHLWPDAFSDEEIQIGYCYLHSDVSNHFKGFLEAAGDPIF
jgi:hypothetical protein